MKSITVVGSGIIGLTSAIALQEVGFQVRIVAKERYEHTLSNNVGAIWFPYEIYPREKTNVWALNAYKRYQKQEAVARGINFIQFISAYNANSNLEWLTLMPDGTVRKAAKEELPKGIANAFIANVPLIEPPLYLSYLFNKFIEQRGTLVSKTINSLKQLSELDHWVINCTGLGAKAICKDQELRPMRGQILICNKLSVPSFADDTQKGALCYVINRSKDSIVGGTDYENDYNTAIDDSDTELIKNRLKGLTLSGQEPKIKGVFVGLRPKRSTVRFEYDAEYANIFHNYGHGGAGFTVAWGCAEELVEIFRKA